MAQIRILKPFSTDPFQSWFLNWDVGRLVQVTYSSGDTDSRLTNITEVGIFINNPKYNSFRKILGSHSSSTIISNATFTISRPLILSGPKFSHLNRERTDQKIPYIISGFKMLWFCDFLSRFACLAGQDPGEGLIRAWGPHGAETGPAGNRQWEGVGLRLGLPGWTEQEAGLGSARPGVSWIAQNLPSTAQHVAATVGVLPPHKPQIFPHSQTAQNTATA